MAFCFKPSHGEIGMLKEWDIHLYGAPTGVQTQALVLWILFWPLSLRHWNPGQRNGGQASGESILSSFHTTTRTASGRHQWVVPILKLSKVSLEVYTPLGYRQTVQDPSLSLRSTCGAWSSFTDVCESKPIFQTVLWAGCSETDARNSVALLSSRC